MRVIDRRTVAVGLSLGLVVVAALFAVGYVGQPPTNEGDMQLRTADPGTGLCTDTFMISRGDGAVGIPICATGDLDSGSETVNRVVIVIHGDGRDAPRYFNEAVRSANEVGAKNALILAPQFPTRADVRRADTSADLLQWTSESWKEGGLSRSRTDRIRLSSFDVIDEVLASLASTERFPSLRTAVIVGHSAGGQFVNRYAAGTRVAEQLGERDVEVQFVVANPSSFVYFDERRIDPSTGQLRALTGPERQACRSYDRYKYGLDHRNEYLGSSTRAQIRRRYAESHITYVAGVLDTDSEAESLDRSCEAIVQGPNRLTRTKNYVSYLAQYFGDDVLVRQDLVLVPDVGHDGGAILNAPEVRPILFGSSDE